MIQEEKSLLLKDLCVRLPYGFIVHRYSDNVDIEINDINTFSHFLEYSEDEDFKPYLRPMSSMTEMEKKEIKELHFYYTDAHIVNDEDNDFKPIIVDEVHCFCIIDWLNKNHFDYRGLIEKGLAIEALDGMYKNK